MSFKTLFSASKPLIACIHLLPLPGAPRYQGNLSAVYKAPLSEVALFARYGVEGFLVENFRDMPFYPQRLPPETIATLAAITRDIVKATACPVGINALRHDAPAALAIATAAQAQFIHVNVHLGAVVADQGLLQGESYATLRLRAALRSEVLIFADVGVKHATPVVNRGLALETQELTERGLVDALIVSGVATGAETRLADIEVVRQHTDLPILLGSGATPDNLPTVYSNVNGLIVGSYFKQAGKADNPVEEARVRAFTNKLHRLHQEVGGGLPGAEGGERLTAE